MFDYNFFMIKSSIDKLWEYLFGDIFMKYVKALRHVYLVSMILFRNVTPNLCV